MRRKKKKLAHELHLLPKLITAGGDCHRLICKTQCLLQLRSIDKKAEAVERKLKALERAIVCGVGTKKKKHCSPGQPLQMIESYALDLNLEAEEELNDHTVK